MRFYSEQNNRRLRAQSDRDDIEIRSRYWKNHAVPKTLFLRRKVAMGMRILWRLLTGCYSLGYQRYMEKAEKA
jgi:hypothetical protein